MSVSPRIAAVGLSILLGLASCSADGSTTAPAASNPVATAAAPTNAAEEVPQAGASVDPARLTSSMSEALKSTRSSHVVMTMTGSVALSMEGDIDTSDQDNPKVSMTMANPGGAGAMQIVIVDKVGYISLDNGATWQKSSQGLDQLTTSLQGQDEYLRYITKAVYVGEEAVGSTPARHYTLTLSPPESLNLGTADIPYDVWINSRNQTIRYTMAVTAQSVNVAYDATMSKLNEPVSISAPPAEKIKG